MKCQDCGSEIVRGFHARADRPLCPKCFRVHNQQFPRPQTISPPKAKASRKRRSPEEKAEEFREALREMTGLEPREGSTIGAIQLEKVNVDRPVTGAVPKAVVDQRLGELFRQFYEAEMQSHSIWREMLDYVEWDFRVLTELEANYGPTLSQISL